MKITCKYQVLFGQVQEQVLWHFHTPSTQVHQVLINIYLSTSTVLDPNPASMWGGRVMSKYFMGGEKCFGGGGGWANRFYGPVKLSGGGGGGYAKIIYGLDA